VPGCSPRSTGTATGKGTAVADLLTVEPAGGCPWCGGDGTVNDHGDGTATCIDCGRQVPA
jgi:hypothetical protein